jgi:hypothetical protein
VGCRREDWKRRTARLYTYDLAAGDPDHLCGVSVDASEQRGWPEHREELAAAARWLEGRSQQRAGLGDWRLSASGRRRSAARLGRWGNRP